MKILSKRNIKDYYDYLQGTLGIDDYVVYDRTKFTLLDKNYLLNYYGTHYTSEKEFPFEQWSNRYVKEPSKFFNCKFFMVEIGMVQYLFVMRIISHKDYELELLQTFNENKKYSKEPITIIFLQKKYRDDNIIDLEDDFCADVEKPVDIKWCRYLDLDEINFDSGSHYKCYIENPILKDTDIPRFISAETVWNNLYNYLLKIKEPEMAQISNDDKILAAGFDKKHRFVIL